MSLAQTAVSLSRNSFAQFFQQHPDDASDGAFIDITEQAKNCGFHCSVAMSVAAYKEVIAAAFDEEYQSSDTIKFSVRDELKILDVLWRLHCSFSAKPTSARRPTLIGFSTCYPAVDAAGDFTYQWLEVIVEKINGEFVITIKLPNEA